MEPERDRLFAEIFHGWVQVFILFAVLFVGLSAWGWAMNRRIPREQRPGITPWGILFIAFALTLVMRAFSGAWQQTILIAASVLASAFISRNVGSRWIWVGAVFLAALLGMGWVQSALALAIVGFVVLLIIGPRT